MDQNERIQAASKFLLQSPPGEINDVLNDVRDIIADDEALQAGALPSLREYNLEQFITADVPGCDHQVIVSEASRVKSNEEGSEERFLDPKSKTTFSFDQLRLEAFDPQPYEPEEESEPLRSALESATATYLANHYHEGVSSVFATPGSSTRYTVQIVANKYNPQNYWSGRWRSEYIVDTSPSSPTISGRILVNVHYYEQGNVQLSTTHSAEIPIPPSALPSSPSSSPPSSSSSPSSLSTSSTKLLAIIQDFESRYQTALSDAYHSMAERTFKSLRRALPLTRQKLDWDKVLGYKLGAELVASRGMGTGAGGQ